MKVERHIVEVKERERFQLSITASELEELNEFFLQLDNPHNTVRIGMSAMPFPTWRDRFPRIAQISQQLRAAKRMPAEKCVVGSDVIE